MSGEKTLTTSQAAAFLQLSESTVRNLVRLKVLRCNKTFGGHFRFSLEVLAKYKESRND